MQQSLICLAAQPCAADVAVGAAVTGQVKRTVVRTPPPVVAST